MSDVSIMTGQMVYIRSLRQKPQRPPGKEDLKEPWRDFCSERPLLSPARSISLPSTAPLLHLASKHSLTAAPRFQVQPLSQLSAMNGQEKCRANVVQAGTVHFTYRREICVRYHAGLVHSIQYRDHPVRHLSHCIDLLVQFAQQRYFGRC